jgi:hypothetical protein
MPDSACQEKSAITYGLINSVGDARRAEQFRASQPQAGIVDGEAGQVVDGVRELRVFPIHQHRDGSDEIAGIEVAVGYHRRDRECDATPPVLQVNGDNPAIVQVGATYTDLGATITGPQQDLNLGIQAIVDGGATTTIGAIEINTSQPGTHTIEYVATDQNGLEGTATRTVDVMVPTGSTQTPAATSTNPSTNDPGDAASSTQATTTAQ